MTGTIWKDVKKKISYLKKLESPQINDLYPENEEKFAGEHDDIYIGNIFSIMADIQYIKGSKLSLFGLIYY